MLNSCSRESTQIQMMQRDPMKAMVSGEELQQDLALRGLSEHVALRSCSDFYQRQAYSRFQLPVGAITRIHSGL